MTAQAGRPAGHPAGDRVGPSVRARIAEATGPIHRALHADAVLGGLIRPDITPAGYRAALMVFQAFYRRIEGERRRLCAWPGFALAAECRALAADLPGAQVLPSELRFADPTALLGGLYVAHGASFGRSSFRASVARALPGEPQAFVRLQGDRDTWRALLAAMEDAGADARGFAGLCGGARAAFGAVARLSAAQARQARSGLPVG